MAEMKEGGDSLRSQLFPLVKTLYLEEKAMITQVNKPLAEQRRDAARVALDSFINKLSEPDKARAYELEEEIEEWCDKNLNRTGPL